MEESDVRNLDRIGIQKQTGKLPLICTILYLTNSKKALKYIQNSQNRANLIVITISILM